MVSECAKHIAIYVFMSKKRGPNNPCCTYTTQCQPFNQKMQLWIVMEFYAVK